MPDPSCVFAARRMHACVVAGDEFVNFQVSWQLDARFVAAPCRLMSVLGAGVRLLREGRGRTAGLTCANTEEADDTHLRAVQVVIGIDCFTINYLSTAGNTSILAGQVQYSGGMCRHIEELRAGGSMGLALWPEAIAGRELKRESNNTGTLALAFA